jgi:hypothetical protein
MLASDLSPRVERLSTEWIALTRAVLSKGDAARARSAELRHMGEGLRRRSADTVRS